MRKKSTYFLKRSLASALTVAMAISMTPTSATLLEVYAEEPVVEVEEKMPEEVSEEVSVEYEDLVQENVEQNGQLPQEDSNLASEMLELPSEEVSSETTSAEDITSVNDSDYIAQGMDGDLKWSIDKEGTLLVEGTGDFRYDTENDWKVEPEWADYGQYIIKNAIIRVHGITRMSGFFANCHELVSVDFTDSDTSLVTDMSTMFSNCDNLKSIDLSGFNTANVVNMYHMFSNCSELTDLDLSNFNTTNVRKMEGLFGGCVKLAHLNLSSFNTENVESMYGMFAECQSLDDVDLSGFNTKNVTLMSYMFGNSGFSSLDLSSFDTSNVTDMRMMFSNCRNLKSLNLEAFNTNNVTTMESMFESCDNLTDLNITSFNTSNVTEMYYMFRECRAIEKLDLGNFDTSNVWSMANMFEGCTNLKELNVSSFDTANTHCMNYMFAHCINLQELDLSNFDTSNVESMNFMFGGDQKLSAINVTDLDMSNVTNMEYMFFGCSELSINVELKNDIENYECAFKGAATAENAEIYVSYAAECSKDTARKVVDTKSDESHVYLIAKEGFGINSWPTDCMAGFGDVATFSVSAEGTDISYQWECSEDDGYTWEPVGVNEAELSVVVTKKQLNAIYRCVVSCDQKILVTKSVRVKPNDLEGFSIALNEQGEITITGYHPETDVAELVIPNLIWDTPVTGIENYAFEFHSELTSVTIPNTITTFGENIFTGCNSLESVTLPENIQKIQWGMFSNCESLKEISIPDSVEIIEPCVFARTGLKKITLPNNLKEIGYGAFTSTELEDIILPDSLEILGENAFEYCSKLRKVVVPGGIKDLNISTFGACTSLKEVIINEGVEHISEAVFYGCPMLTDITIPSSIIYIDDTAIGATDIGYSFDAIENITIHCEEGSYAHEFAKEHGFKVEFIGEKDNPTTDSDYEYKQVTDTQGNESVIITGINADNDQYDLPEEVDGKAVSGTIAGAFAGDTKVTSTTIPGTYQKVENETFKDCTNLRSAEISEGVKEIGNEAFEGTAIEEQIIPHSVEIIGDSAFANNLNLQRVEFVEGAANARTRSVMTLAAEDVLVLNGLKTIGNYAFYNCPKLHEVTIPKSVQVIGEKAFGYTDNGKVNPFVISCYKDSAAHKYAVDNGLDFQLLDTEHVHELDGGTVIKTATCYEEGIVKYTCSCGYETTEMIAKNPSNHAGGTEVRNKKEATCASTGYTGDTYCKGCKVKISSGKVLAKNPWNHAGGTEVKNAKEATCGTEGYTGDVYCKGCSSKISSGNTISATGKHVWDSGVITKEPTEDTEGIRTFTCTVCNQGKTEMIPVIEKEPETEPDTPEEPEHEHKFEGGLCECGEINMLSTPQLTGIVNGLKGVIISWNKVDGADNYRIYRKADGATKWSKVGDTTELKFTDTSAKSGTTYYYTVRCYNLKVCKPVSDYNKTGLKIICLKAGTPSALANTSAGIKVTWNKISGAKGYYIYRKSGSDSYKKIATIKSGSTLSYIDKSSALKNGTSYTYTIRAYNGQTLGNYSGKSIVRLTSTSISKLANPSTKSMKVTWKKQSKASGYEVQYSTSKTFAKGNKTVIVKGASTVSTTVKSLTKGKVYYVRVRAYKTVKDYNDYSAWSGIKSIKIKK